MQALWEERYGAEAFAYGTAPNEFLEENIDALPHGAVLCLAEGEGRNAVFIASTGRSVSSIDLSPAGVAKTLRLASERGVTVQAAIGDLATADLGTNSVDAVVSIFAHVPSAVRIEITSRRVVEALRPGGVILLEAYTPGQIGRTTGGPQVEDLTMSLAQLREELAPMEFLHGVELERSVVEGLFHTGLGAVVQVIARKPE